LDDKIRELLKQLGNAINESISSSEDVNDQIQKIRDEGYNLYVVLDATIGLNRDDEDEPVAPPPATTVDDLQLRGSELQVQFRINVNDLAMLRSLGIDPTRKVRTRRLEPRAADAD
jgi:hypothetical protein